MPTSKPAPAQQSALPFWLAVLLTCLCLLATSGCHGKRRAPAVTLVSLAITPPAPKVAAGFTQALVATGTFSDQTTGDLTASVTWESLNPAVATVSNAVGSQGLVSSLTAGSVLVTATDPASGIAASTSMAVTAAVLLQLEVTPATPSVAAGFTLQFTATGVFSDATVQDLTTAVAWDSSNAAAATISSAPGSEGLATGVSVGASTIQATHVGSGVQGSTSLTVTPAVLVEVGVTPALPSIALGYDQPFTATGLFSDNTTQDITTDVTWSSSATATATISNASGAQGLATSAATGSTTITATHTASLIAGSTTFVVTPAVLVSIAVDPGTQSIALGYEQQFTATGTFSDDTTQDITTEVTWSSSAEASATISNAGGSRGLATSAANGSTTITATEPATGIVGSASLTVTPAALVSIAVTPATPELALGYEQQFTTTGTFSDNSTQDITTAVTWSSSATATATISNAGGTHGLATSAATGSTTISATDPATSISGQTSLTVTAAVLVAVAVTPPAPSIALGYEQQFTATGTFSDNSTQDITAAVAWSSSVPVATVSNASGSAGLASSAIVGSTTITAVDAATGNSGSTTLDVTAAVLVSIAVEPATQSIALGYEQQYTATGTFSDNSTQDLTTAVTWSSSAEASATISNAGGARGLATSAANGSTTITATDPETGISGQASLTVTLAALVSISVTPATPQIALGYEQQFTATGTFSDNSTQDLTTAVTWSSSTEASATISNAFGSHGLATSAATGSTVISATDPATSIFGQTSLTVTTAVLVAVAVTPPAPSIALGYEQQFTATGTFSDNSTQDITTAVTWSSSTEASATISNAGGSAGLASSAAVGSTTITAVDAATAISGSTPFDVTPAVVVAIDVTPPTPSVALGYGQQFTATGTFSDDTTQDITTAVTWSSSATAVATISNADGTRGLAASAAEGVTVIGATDPATGIAGSTTLTVTPAVLVSIAVTPATPQVALGYELQFTATGTFSDNSTQDLTAVVTWGSSTPATATISNADGTRGLASSAAAGSTTITATDAASSIAGSTTFAVTPAVLVSIAVAPVTQSIALGLEQQFTASGTFSDASIQDVTAQVTWSSSTLATASISNAAGSAGLAASAAPGSTTITATDSTTGVANATTLTVTAAVLVSIAVTPTAPSVALGNTQQFTATGTFSDASISDLTTSVTWSSSDTSVATISNANGSRGLASSAGTGSTTVDATDPGTGIASSTTMSVSPAALLSISVSPLDPFVALGLGQQFTATGTFSDNSTQDLTASVVWSSSNPAAATISNAIGSQGFATSVAQGATTIAANHGASGFSASTTLNVGDPVVFRSARTARSPSALSLTIATPTGTAAGEAMLAAITVVPSSAVVTAPSGWTLVRRSDNSPPKPSSLVIYSRLATAAEPANHVWTLSTSQGSAGCIVTFQGVDTAAMIDTQNGQATPSALTHTTPSITTSAANAMLVTFHAMTSSASWTAPAGMTEVVDLASGTVPSNSGISLVACFQFQAVAGSTGARTATASNNATSGNAVIVALRD